MEIAREVARASARVTRLEEDFFGAAPPWSLAPQTPELEGMFKAALKAETPAILESRARVFAAYLVEADLKELLVEFRKPAFAKLQRIPTRLQQPEPLAALSDEHARKARQIFCATRDCGLAAPRP
jgi:hypothetical protein